MNVHPPPAFRSKLRAEGRQCYGGRADFQGFKYKQLKKNFICGYL